MASIFQFKQFAVDQTGCAMKINTDGVLLGAIAGANNPETILDIGTGTGVIALMLAQRFETAKIDAVEIDEGAAQTAEMNFKASPFAERLAVFASGFESYFIQFSERKYDLIISNPPFYIDSLKSPEGKKTLAKHTGVDFFEQLVKGVAAHLNPDGICWLVIPVTLTETVFELVKACGMFVLQSSYIKSYPTSEPHRVIFSFGFKQVSTEISTFTIYKSPGVYSDEYSTLLKPYFLAF